MITDIIKSYYDDTIKGLIDSYDQKGLRASGRYARELKSVITSSGTKINAKITGPIESYFMEQGRNPNKIQTLGMVRYIGKILEQWVIDKGIQVNPYAAAHKIVHEGIRVPNKYNPGGAISDVINDDWFDELNKKIRFYLITDIKSDVISKFKE
jgi:hypothetical protein